MIIMRETELFYNTEYTETSSLLILFLFVCFWRKKKRETLKKK